MVIKCISLTQWRCSAFGTRKASSCSTSQGTTGDCPDGSVLRGLDLLRSWRTGREPWWPQPSDLVEVAAASLMMVLSLPGSTICSDDGDVMHYCRGPWTSPGAGGVSRTRFVTCVMKFVWSGDFFFWWRMYSYVRATNIMARGVYCIYATDSMQTFVKETNSTQAGTARCLHFFLFFKYADNMVRFVKLVHQIY